MDSLEVLIAAEIVKARLRGDDFYFTVTCPMRFSEDAPPCGQKFKVLRHTGGSPVCPKCFCTINIHNIPGFSEAMRGIPVND
jgi:hypothetical protein